MHRQVCYIIIIVQHACVCGGRCVHCKLWAAAQHVKYMHTSDHIGGVPTLCEYWVINMTRYMPVR